MKIAITGHTKGIGKACADLFNHHTIMVILEAMVMTLVILKKFLKMQKSAMCL